MYLRRRLAMSRPLVRAVPRRPTNITLPAPLLAEARTLGLNVSQVCERGLVAEIAAARARQWLLENREALESSRRYVERNGLPLAEYRQF